jgi:two-component system, NarL family, capsular synthesis sensor histidine kinase RcsC
LVQELLDFLNKAPIAMHWLSGTGHVLWANETEMNALGYTPEEYIGQPIMNFCPDEQELVLEIFKTLGSGNTIQDVPVRFRTKSGEIKHLLIDSNVNWNPDGSFKHTRCFIRDDTGRKVREARLEERHRSVVEMAKAKDKFMRKVFHEIKTPCHLLSSVLDCADEGEADASLLADAKYQAGVLRNLVDDAVDAALFDDGRVPMLEPAPFSLHQRVNGLCRALDAELGARCGKGVERTVSFGISTAAASVGTWASGAEPCAHVPDMVEGDWRYLSRVLRHLLTNALRHTGAGRVGLSVTYELGRFKFAVRDTGCGVDADEVRSMFRQYWHLQVPATPAALAEKAEGGGADGELGDLATDKDGLGLGLNVSFNIVQSMGGELDVESRPGAPETLFYFTVPLRVLPHQPPPLPAPAAPAAAAAVQAREAVPAASARPAPAAAMPAAAPGRVQRDFDQFSVPKPAPAASAGRVQRDFDDLYTTTPSSWMDVTASAEAGRHVAPPGAAEAEAAAAPAVGLAAASARTPHCLVVDDNAICQKVAKKMLESLGCTVETAGNGLEAVMRIKAAPWSFDFVLMDLRMPVMDGIDATVQIRKQMRLLSLPIVAFSAEVGDDVRELCADARFDGFLPKPADRAALRAELDRLVVSAGAGQCAAAAFAASAEEALGLPAAVCRAAAAAAEPLPAAAAATPQAAGVSAGPLRVLAVDDNAICLKVVKRMLDKVGCAVTLANNGLEAVEAVRAAPGGFDFVLMDLRMPVMDGIDATLKIRKELGLAALPIVAFSAEVLRPARPAQPAPPRPTRPRPGPAGFDPITLPVALPSRARRT